MHALKRPIEVRLAMDTRITPQALALLYELHCQYTSCALLYRISTFSCNFRTLALRALSQHH